MKKNNKNGFFLSETMVVIAVVAVVLLGVFKLFNSVYFKFIESENYNTVNAINALSNVQKYYESKGNIDTTIITEEISYVDLTNYESYNSDYYTRLKEEFKIDGIYLMDLNKLYTSDINNFYINFRKYLNTLKNIQGIVLVISIDGKEFAYTEIENYQSVTLIGDEEDEFAVYVPIGGTFTEPGYKNWEGEDPTITWENDEEVDINKAGTYYKYYDFNGYLLRRKIQVGNHTLAKYVDSLESLEESEEEVYTNGLVQTTVEYEGTTYDAGIRYVGAVANVNNNVYYNCEDKDSSGVSYGATNYDYVSSCEVWRIIGVFNTKASESGREEKRIKLVNTNSTFAASWDSSASSGDNAANSGWGINQWGASGDYLGADLMQLLNGFYIGVDGAECKYCNAYNQSTCSNECTTESLKAVNMKPLTSNALNMIGNAVWDTYAVHFDLYPLTNNKAALAYLQEKGISTQYTGKICTSGTKCNDSVTRTTSWTGLVGLMSAADAGYTGAWLYRQTDTSIYPWTISSIAYSEGGMLVWRSSTSYVGTYNTYEEHYVFPSLYLKSSIEIVSGSGTETSPYIIK